MSGVIRTVPCGCESGQPCTPATRCAITTVVHIQREDDEAEMERLREDHEAELAALRADAEIGQRWKRDNSLETWFPYTAEELTRLRAELVAARARADAAVAEAAEHKMFREESARRLAQCRVDRDRLRAAGRALLACPHIAERDTDPDWVDAETEAAVAEMRDALKEGGQ